MDVIALTEELVAIPSVTPMSNMPIIEKLEQLLADANWQIERTDYVDRNGVTKGNIVAKLGEGTGGLAFCSHVDTVPGQEQDWPAFSPEIREGNLFGRGSCDMKGPLAATLVAALAVDSAALKKPIYMVLTADEEWGLEGAKYLKDHSKMLINERPAMGVIAEPTSMVPVYSHKGFCAVYVKVKGRAAHSSTGLGDSALMKAVPFMSDLVAFDKLAQTDASFMNDLYTPPHHTINFVIDTGDVASNVTAPFADIKIALRGMPDARTAELAEMIVEKAVGYGFEVETDLVQPLFTSQTSDLIQACIEFTDAEPETVAYGTDGNYLMEVIKDMVILGPGSIDVAHTVGEFVPVAELHQAVDVYAKLIERFCVEG